MSLASLREVYNPLAIKTEVKPPLQDWKESVPVILLSEYLRINKEHGIILQQSDGIPCLCFNPRLKKKEIDPTRWAIAENAAQLFLDAVDDLKELITNGKLQLPVHEHNNINNSIDQLNKNRAGPSGVSLSIRLAKPH